MLSSRAFTTASTDVKINLVISEDELKWLLAAHAMTCATLSGDAASITQSVLTLDVVAEKLGIKMAVSIGDLLSHAADFYKKEKTA